MTWFLKAQGAVLGVGVIAAAAIFSAVMPNVSVLMPSIGRGLTFTNLPFSAVLPLAAVIAIGAFAGLSSSVVSRTSVRDLGRYTVLYFMCCAIVFCSLSLTANATLSDTLHFESVRSFCGFLAIEVAAAAVLGLAPATSVPVIYVFVSTVFGRAADGSAQPWAWPTQAAAISDALVSGAVLCLVAAVVLFFQPVLHRDRIAKFGAS